MPIFKCCFAIQQMLPSTVRTVSSKVSFLVLIDSSLSSLENAYVLEDIMQVCGIPVNSTFLSWPTNTYECGGKAVQCFLTE